MKSDNPQFVPPIVNTELPKNDWRNKYPKPDTTKTYKLEDSSDDSTLNRMIQLRVFEKTEIIEGKPGALYFDKVNGKVKIFISDSVGWKNLAFEP